MYGILEEFYYGNIDPQMREVNKNSKLYKMIFRMEKRNRSAALKHFRGRGKRNVCDVCGFSQSNRKRFVTG